MSIWHWFDGSVRLRLTGGLGERLLNECSRLDVVIENVHATQFGFEFSTSPQDLGIIRMVAKRCRCELTILERYGAPFQLRRFRKRGGLAAGALLAVGLLLWEPHSIWNIDFYDFTPEQEKRLRAELYAQGVCEGALADGAQLNIAESRILENEEEFGWLQLNFVHGRIVVEKTNAVPIPHTQEQETLTSLIASMNGIVRRFDLQGGYIQVEPGQAVVRGELLVNAATVGKRTGKLLYSSAQGAVWAETQQVFRYFIAYETPVDAPTGEHFESFALITPFGRIQLGDSEPEGMEAADVRAEPLTFFGLHLPATLEISTFRPEVTQLFSLTREQAIDIARSRIYDAVNSTLPPYEILEREETVEESSEGVTLTMHLRVLTDIARQVPYTVEMQPEIPEEFR